MLGRYAWCQVIVVVTAPCAVAGVGDYLYLFFFTYFEKEKFAKVRGDDKTRNYVNQNV